MNDKSFAELEQEGWQRNAFEYDSVVLPATRQAFRPLLDSAGVRRGHHVLEIASGTGHLTADTLAREATVVGVDIAANMVALARQHVSGASFNEGDAEALPFDDQQFDVVLCCFGFLHVPQPARAFREAARVLKPKGIISFTAWCAPEQGGKFFELILKTYQSHGNMDVALPPAPPMFELADANKRDQMLTAAGFREICAQHIPIIWPVQGPEALFEFVMKGAVRTRMIYDRQTPEAQQRIRDALVAATLPYLSVGGIPSPAVLVTASKA